MNKGICKRKAFCGLQKAFFMPKKTFILRGPFFLQNIRPINNFHHRNKFYFQPYF
jgi:hypothetical protein